MNTRLHKLVEYKTEGKQVEFAELVGWSPQYLQNLLNGSGSIGIRPVITLLEKIPELNARWFILGEGTMINSGAEQLKNKLKTLLDVEVFMPVMNIEELKQVNSGNYNFDEQKIKKWNELLCKHQTAKKL